MTNLSISTVLFLKFPLHKKITWGIFSVRDEKDSQKDDFDALQDELQRKITGLMDQLRFPSDKRTVLELLSSLMKGSSTIGEVKKAEEGLISFLRTPGLGLEEGEVEKTIVLLKDYAGKKIAKIMESVRESVEGTLKNNPLNTKDKNNILTLIDKLIKGSSQEEIQESAQKAADAVDNSSLEADIKKDLKESIAQIKDAKESQISKMNQAGSAATPSINSNQQGQGGKGVNAYINSNQQGQGMGPLPKNGLDRYPLKRIVYYIIVFLVLSIPILFIILYLLSLREKKKILSFYNNPKEFIIRIFENLKRILLIFGLKYQAGVSPLVFADSVQHKYAVKDNTFLILTEKFQEAKYSKHVLQSNDAILVLDNYNKFLHILFMSDKKIILFFRFISALMNRRPLFIDKKGFINAK